MEPERNVTDDAIGLSYRLYGAAPVQAEGIIAGKPFYFRARHEEWSFSVAPTAEADPVDVESERQGFYREGQYGRRDEASYMPFDTAEAIIKGNVHDYLRHVAV